MDGGYGWVVVFCCFSTNLLVCILVYPAALFIPEMVSVYGATPVSAALIPSIQFSLYHLFGPIASSLVEMFDCRTAVLAGTILCAFPYLLCAAVTTFWPLYILYAILPGIGQCLQVLSLTLIIQYYFDKRRALAAGISYMGGPVGLFIAPLLARFFLDTYDLHGCILLIGALYLNSLPLAWFMRPVVDNSLVQEPSTTNNDAQLSSKFTVDKSVFPKQPANTDEKFVSPKQSPNAVDQTFVQNESTSEHSMHRTVLENKSNSSNGANNETVLQKLLPENSNQYLNQEAGLTDNKDNSASVHRPRLLWTLKNSLFGIVELFSELRHGEKMLLFLGSALMFSGFQTCSLLATSKGLENGLGKWEAAFLVSISGIACLIGGLVSGILGSTLKVSLFAILTVGMTTAAVGNFTLGIAQVFPTLTFGSFVCGIGNSFFFALMPSALVELFGLSNLTRMYGLVNFAYGIGLITGPPLQAYVANAFQSFSYAFYLGATCQLLGAALFLVVFLYTRRGKCYHDDDDTPQHVYMGSVGFTKSLQNLETCSFGSQVIVRHWACSDNHLK